MRTGPRSGRIALSFERGNTSAQRLKVDWLHPVPPARSGRQTQSAGPLSLSHALSVLWEDDERPLLVLRECAVCKDSDDALLSRSLNNDRTMLLTKWFRTVRLPAHCVEPNHPFYGVFASYTFEQGLPHFFLLASPDAKPVRFTGQQTQTQLVKGMSDVLSQRYAKDPAKAVKQWLSVLGTFDKLDARRHELQQQLDHARATEGPQSEKATKLAKDLAHTAAQREEALALELKVRDLGLLPMPRQAFASTTQK